MYVSNGLITIDKYKSLSEVVLIHGCAVMEGGSLSPQINEVLVWLWNFTISYILHL